MTPKSALHEQILAAYNFRHAAKVFDPAKKISEADFNLLLEVGRQSPSSFGLEPWQMLVVQDPDKRALLEPNAWGANGKMNGTDGQLATSSHFIIFLAHTGATMSHESDYPARHLRDVKKFPDEVVPLFLEAYKKFQTEDFDLNSEQAITDWSARQAYIALGNMMTAAAMMEIDSCPIEGFDAARISETLAADFGVDTSIYKPAVMVAFGYRAGEPMFPKSRRELDEIVRWV